ncbi:beta-1,4-galactosyltransferase galt-1-like [Tachypleus tridentatus]|uniref:beta-1,4-galactosyltransferase galt-1-like n=1 Tax=Tachypleus tridentatus TaxID=6853 RepID=UPI003FD56AD2
MKKSKDRINESMILTGKNSTLQARQDNWNKVTENIYVFSSFWDDRLKPLKRFVRVVAVGHRDGLEQKDIRCITHDQHTNISIILPTSFEIIQEHHNQLFSAMYFFCYCDSKSSPPLFVALRHIPTLLESAKLPVHNRNVSEVRATKNELAVCVRPFFGPFNNTLALAEFVALYHNLGVSQFTFYDYKITNQVRKFISSLQEEGLNINLLSWSLPDPMILSTWAYGQVASNQDCVYRHMFDYNYVLLVDIDEFLFPRKHETLQEMIKSFPIEKWGSLEIRNAFFCKENPVEFVNWNASIPLASTRFTERETKIWKSKNRSKIIVQPFKIITCGIHFVWKHFDAWNAIVVSPSVCLMHHYRDGTCSNDSQKIKDNHALKYKKQLLTSKVIKIWKELFW